MRPANRTLQQSGPAVLRSRGVSARGAGADGGSALLVLAAPTLPERPMRRPG